MAWMGTYTGRSNTCVRINIKKNSDKRNDLIYDIVINKFVVKNISK